MYLNGELRAVIDRQWELRKEHLQLLPYVFLNENGTDKVKEFKKTWKRVCKETKVGDKLLHDFRRTAVRNMIQAGIPERFAMQISGRRTRSVFERYTIASDSDLRLAATKHEAYLNEKSEVMGTISGTILFLAQETATQVSSQVAARQDVMWWR